MGDSLMDDAWEAFDSSERGLDPSKDERDLFTPWLIYDWEPWPDAGSRRRSGRLTAVWKAHFDCLDDFSRDESEFLLTVARTPTSFHEVIACGPGPTVGLRDLLLETETVVVDHQAPSRLQPGQILYARAAAFSDCGLFVGAGQYIIPPELKLSILDIRKALRPRFRKLTVERLCIEEPFVRTAYFQLRDAMLHPAPPELRNTDGDPMEFHTLTYKVTSFDAAVSALASLSEEPKDRLLDEAGRPRPGGSKRVELAWTKPGNAMHGGMGNTVLAEFKINGTTLTVEVNSAERAKRVKAEVARRLGDGATLVRDEGRSLADEMATATAGPESKRDRIKRQRDEELQALPEIQAMLTKLNAEHYETWPDIPIPALKGKTPRQAMKSREGRERVEALIAKFEQQQRSGRLPHYDFNQLRAALGLPLREA